MRMLHPPQWRVDPFLGSEFDFKNFYSTNLDIIYHSKLQEVD